MEVHIQQPTNAEAPWNVLLPVDSTVSSSEISEEDENEVFADTYSDIDNISSQEPQESSRGPDEAIADTRNQLSSSIDPKMEESLMKRVASLKEAITNLRASLSEENRLWKQECEEYDRIHEGMKLNALEEARTAARVASEAYVVESRKGLMKKIDGSGHFSSIQTCHRMPLTLPEVKSPFTIHQNLLTNDYYKKLDQVERLCNEELLKIRNDADELQPLKQMVSEWDITNEEKLRPEMEEVQKENYA